MPKIEFFIATPDEFQFAGEDRTSFAKPSSLSPLQAYLGLKSLFGKPNREFTGLLMEGLDHQLVNDPSKPELDLSSPI